MRQGKGCIVIKRPGVEDAPVGAHVVKKPSEFQIEGRWSTITLGRPVDPPLVIAFQYCAGASTTDVVSKPCEIGIWRNEFHSRREGGICAHYNTWLDQIQDCAKFLRRQFGCHDVGRRAKLPDGKCRLVDNGTSGNCQGYEIAGSNPSGAQKSGLLVRARFEFRPGKRTLRMRSGLGVPGALRSRWYRGASPIGMSDTAGPQCSFIAGAFGHRHQRVSAAIASWSVAKGPSVGGTPTTLISPRAATAALIPRSSAARSACPPATNRASGKTP